MPLSMTKTRRGYSGKYEDCEEDFHVEIECNGLCICGVYQLGVAGTTLNNQRSHQMRGGAIIRSGLRGTKKP
jgi:hypothetical protein